LPVGKAGAAAGAGNPADPAAADPTHADPVLDDLLGNLNQPPREPADEAARIRDRARARRNATAASKELLAFRDQERPDADFLSFALVEARQALDELHLVQIQAPTTEDSKHQRELRRAIHVGQRLLDRVDPPAVLQQPVTPPPPQQATHIRPAPQLPVFGDGITPWQTFWGLFAAGVHRQQDLSPAEKMAVLVPLLRGPAAESISGLAIDDTNYGIAIETLTARFDRPERRKEDLLEFLTTFKVPSETKAARRAVDQLLSATRQLRTLDVDPKELDTILRPRIVSRLPDTWRKRWARKKRTNPHLSINELLAFLEEEVEILEEVDHTPDRATSQRGPPNPPASAFEPPATVSALAATSQPSAKNRNCTVCNRERHSIASCPVFAALDPDAREAAVRQGNMCFNCLGPHRVSACTSTYRCRTCRARHHTSICRAVEASRPAVDAAAAPWQHEPPPPPPLPPVPVVRHVAAAADPAVYSMTAVAHLVDPRGATWRVRVLFDTGSDLSYVRASVADALDLPVTGRSVFACTGFQEVREEARTYLLVAARLQSRFSGETVDLHLWRAEKLCAPLSARAVPVAPTDLSAPLADDFGAGAIDIIVGTADYNSLVSTEQLTLTTKLRAISTVFGWVIHGTTGAAAPFDPPLATRRCNASAVHLFSDLELLGIRPEHEEDAPEHRPPVWNEEHGKIEIGLRWKSSERPIANRSSAYRRLLNQRRKLDPASVARFQTYVDEKAAEGVIAVAPPEWAAEKNQFFLPHRAIQQGKFRVVFDASAPDRLGRSLNSFLDPGPNLLEHLLHVLLRFRSDAVGAQADCRAAFHQVLLPQEDHRFVQFLWKEEAFFFRAYPFGLCCSPFALQSAIDFLLTRHADQHAALVQKLRRGLYCDDLTATFSAADEADAGMKDAVTIFGNGGLHLHKLRRSGDDRPPAPLLGLIWDTRADRLGVTPPAAPPNLETRRELQSAVSRIWDPLGVLTPWVVPAKILVQESFAATKGWDDPLPSALVKRAADHLHVSRNPVQIPRAAHQGPYELRVFCDASAKAFATCIYCVDGSTGTSTLLVAKSRLAPAAKPLTIPRLELLAALIGSRLAASVRNAANVQPSAVRFFTDSTDVLFWLQRRKALPVFVTRRVDEILGLTRLEEWSHVATHLNAADVASRGCSLDQLRRNPLWWEGPASALLDPTLFAELTTAAPRQEEPPPAEVGMYGAHVAAGTAHAGALHSATATSPSTIPPLLDLARFSSLQKAVRVAAYVKRFADRCRRLTTTSDPATSPALSHDEISAARRLLITQAQQDAWPDDEYLCRFRRLRPALHNGIVTVAPRTRETGLILLPPLHPITGLVVSSAHRRAFHAGVGATIAILNADYHVARSAVRAVVARCGPCRRFRALACRGPEGPLPPHRAEYHRPFLTSGADFLGPLYVNGSKRYVLLFTCDTTRAVHLELTASMGEADTVLAVRRFLALRGTPQRILTDNAATFKRLATVLAGTVRWLFIPPRAPWWGGYWERLVGITKKSLRIALHGQRLSDPELTVILYELSLYINMRPIITGEEGAEPLTPAHFVLGWNPSAILDTPPEENVVDLHSNWRRRTRLSRELRRRWHTEYLPTLRDWRRPSSGKPLRLPRVGAVVLVAEDNAPRSLWHYAVIQRLITGRDGHPRAAAIRLRGKDTSRPLERLYALEADAVDARGESDYATVQPEGGNDMPSIQVSPASSARPDRTGAAPEPPCPSHPQAPPSAAVAGTPSAPNPSASAASSPGAPAPGIFAAPPAATAGVVQDPVPATTSVPAKDTDVPGQPSSGGRTRRGRTVRVPPRFR
jgi:hypothetical protein